MKKILIPLLATALFIVAVGLFINKSSGLSFNLNPVATEEKHLVKINEKDIEVTLAKTDKEREDGLSGVTSLEENSGMLFIFEDSDKPQVFWMKDVLIPIDIFWIKNGKIIRIDKDVPAPEQGTPDEKLTRYSAGVPVDYVLEVNAGYSDSNSFKVGDEVVFSGI